MAAGSAVMTNQKAGETTDMTVTLPAGRFSKPPAVTATASTTVPFTTVRGVSVGYVTKDSFNVYVNRTTSTNTRVNWVAVEEW